MLLKLSRFLLPLFCFSSVQTSSFSKETTLLLIRHGETDWNKEGRTQGHINIPLNEMGILQAKELAEKLMEGHANISAIYSSDLDRAYTTALQTAKRLNLPIQSRVSLREYNWGSAEGMLIAERNALFDDKEIELKNKYPYWKERYDFTCVPDSETINQLIERFRSELVQIAKSHPGEKIAVFTHGRAIRSFLISLFDSEDVPAFENCEFAEICYSSKSVEPFVFIKTEHLAPD